MWGGLGGWDGMTGKWRAWGLRRRPGWGREGCGGGGGGGEGGGVRGGGGGRWRRADETAGAGIPVSGISGVQGGSLAKGGYDFLMGDGGLRYGRETIVEAYYSARVVRGVFATVDVQHVGNPAYNRDRGPV